MEEAGQSEEHHRAEVQRAGVQAWRWLPGLPRVLDNLFLDLAGSFHALNNR
jgi:hypothetical protein